MATEKFTTRRRGTLADRFWAKVQKAGPDECWTWLAATNHFGYGLIVRGGRGTRNERAHRVSWELAFGAIPAGMFVCHRCDNPPCVNPSHLFIGTADDNHRDMRAKGRFVKPNTTGNTKLTESAVREIRARYAAGGVSQATLAAEYNICRSEISHITTGRHWSHVA